MSIKIFNKIGGWLEKVNFVDDNNVVLGYDMEQDCCECADWFIADVPTYAAGDRDESCDGGPINMPGWNFDPTYFKHVEDDDAFDAGGIAIFRIVNGEDEKFIHLFNCHNGYYWHGFEFKCGETIIEEGGL